MSEAYAAWRAGGGGTAARVPTARVHAANDAPLRPERHHVLLWLVTQRRLEWNHALDRAVELANELDRPILVLEALRHDAPHASERTHRFIIEGMAHNARHAAQLGLTYVPYVEPAPAAGRGLLAALAADVAAVVTDLAVDGWLDRMQRAAAARLDVRVERIDARGLVPVGDVPDPPKRRAVDLRRVLHRRGRDWLAEGPQPDPTTRLSGRAASPAAIPDHITAQWPAADLEALLAPGALAALGIASTPPALAWCRGGAPAARAALTQWLTDGLPRYADLRSHPDEPTAATGLSPWLHFGHLSAHEVLHAVLAAHDWTPDDLAHTTTGAKAGWWGLPEPAEAFLDELVTWRDLGAQFAHHTPHPRALMALPAWAQATLAAHATDPRPHSYDLATLEAGETHDELWNAAQRQLVHEGRIHNHLRMLWGKHILAWSDSPHQALERLFHLNDRYAIDGRDPNTITGVLWVLGGFDRAWGPERPVFGKVRYMTSASARRKLRLKAYLQRWAPPVPDDAS